MFMQTFEFLELQSAPILVEAGFHPIILVYMFINKWFLVL